jgi:hypothetical protein
VVPNCDIIFGSYALSNCLNLTNVELPDGMLFIKEGFLANCVSLPNIGIPTSVQLIEHHAFSGCAALREIDLPNSLTNIGEYAFADCTTLTRIVVPDSVETIQPKAFSGCSSLAIVSLPRNPNLAIANNVFHGCNSLMKLELPRMALAVWPRFLEQYNANSHTCLARIGLSEVGRKTCAFSFLLESMPQLFEASQRRAVVRPREQV